MRVLFLTQIVPYPPDSGPKVKTYHVLRYLAERGYNVTLLSFVRPAETTHLDALKKVCAEVYAVPMRRSISADVRALPTSLLSGQPFLVTRDARPEMTRRIKELTRSRRYDLVHADQLTMAQFALQAEGPRRVFDAHNAVWSIVERSAQTAPVFLRPVLSMETRRTRRYEGELVRGFDHTLVVSDVDRDNLLRAAAGGNSNSQGEWAARLTVIPIAVDCRALAPVRRTEGSTNILTASTLFYPPNADGVRWFAREVYPLVRRQVPEATLTIVGPRPPRDIAALAVEQAPQIKVTGYVPDLVPYLRAAAVMVVPVRSASGMRVRILEALARGVPVVTTTTGVEGIAARDQEHLLIADSPQDFAAAVARVIRDPDLGCRLAAQGRALAEREYDWQVALPKLEAVYESVMTERGK